MAEVTAAVTRKGERRRYALVTAAAELLCEGGFDAVSHRSVAERAGLPLASTTYYFASLDELVAQAVEYLGAQESVQLRERLAAVPRRRRGPEAAADVLVDLLAADATREQTISRYERYIACARHPELRGVEQRLLKQRTDAVAFDAATGKLYAQPRTFDAEQQVLRTELASFSRETGVDLEWRPLPDDLDAGGLAVVDADRLVLGAGPRLYRYDLGASELAQIDHLAGFGVTEITGLTVDPAARTLLVLDGGRDELVEIAISDLSF